MEIFDKELNLKDYDCCKVKGTEKQCHPFINLYIQTTSACNGRCKFCDTRNRSINFNFQLLDQIITTLLDKKILGKIAIAGGEPLLAMDRTIEIIKRYQNLYLTLNTNAFNADNLEKVYPYVKEIDISKHHYLNEVNDKIMGLKTVSIQELKILGLTEKTSINCIFQKEGLKTKEDAIKMMNLLGKYDIKRLKLMSLLPLTEYAKINYINLVPLMKEFESELNEGYVYDKNMCQCFRFLYVTNNGNVVKTTIREVFDDNYPCIKQFVFNGENLFDGFKKNNIIL